MCIKIIKFSLVFIYPLLLLLLSLYLYRNKNYNSIIKKYKNIIMYNTIIALCIFIFLATLFFVYEDTIYVYDSSGYWTKFLSLRHSFKDASAIFENLLYTMNYTDYSTLPVLFIFLFSYFGSSYFVYILGIIFFYFTPLVYLMNICYFKFTNKHKRVPIFLVLLFFPIYISIFYGMPDISGFMLLTYIFMLFVIPSFNNINKHDYLLLNILMFILIFLRRWYIFPAATIYLIIFVKYLINNYKDIFSQKSLNDFTKILMSGLPLLIILIIFFRPYINVLLFNKFDDSYSYYQRNNHLIELVNFYSMFFIIIFLYGIFKYIRSRENLELFFYNAILFIIPLVIFASIQSLEIHHYYIITLPLFALWSYSIYQILDNNKILGTFTISLCILQLIHIFVPNNIDLYLATSVKKAPIKLENKDKLIEVSNDIESIVCDYYIYVASGGKEFNEDYLKNAKLPTPTKANYVYATLDARDIFPDYIQGIDYILLTDPIQYYDDPSHQQLYTIINKAITEEVIFKDIYKVVYTNELYYNKQVDVTLYQKVSPLTNEHLEWFYNEYTRIYPEKEYQIRNKLQLLD